MSDPNRLRYLARKCRELAKRAMRPESIAQLRLWAAELADAADGIERSGHVAGPWWRYCGNC